MKLWKVLLVLFFAFVLFDGALRKWALPSLSRVLYLVKDVVLFASIVSYAFSRPFRLPAPLRGTWLPVLISLYAGWTLITACNFNVPNLAVAAIGIKSHLLYLSLLVLVPAALQETRRPGRLVVWSTTLIVVPILLLGMYQFYQSPSDWINKYVGDAEFIANVGGRPRITGTFSYIAGMVTFIKFSVGLSFGLLVAGVMRKDWRLTSFAGVIFALSLVVGPMTGSRSSVLIPAVAFVGTMFFVVQKKEISSALIGGLAVVAILTVSLAYLGGLGGGWTGVMQRFENSKDTNRRITDVVSGPMQRLGAGGFLGYGTGTAHQAAGSVTSAPAEEWRPEVYVEGEQERILVSQGPLGVLFYLTMKLWVTLASIQALLRARGAFETGVCTTAFAYLLMHSIVGQMVYSPPAGAMYWGLAGLALTMWCRQEIRVIEQHDRLYQPSPDRNRLVVS